jgi:hypothetical protein
MNHTKELMKFFANGDYEVVDGGILIHRAALAHGRYYHTVNGQDERIDPNLLPAEGIAYILGASIGATAKLSNFYLAIYSGNVTPAANWTAANFHSNATEITSQTEGYSNATRPIWTPSSVTGGVIGNLSTRATYNVVCSSSLNVAGAALLSDGTRGGTNGILVSATRYASVRIINNGDAFEVGYEVELTDS